MSDVFSTPVPSSTPLDLSKEIALSVERLPGDIVRCVHIVQNTYRCNWWSRTSSKDDDNPGMKGGQIGTSHRVRKSRLLHVIRAADKLVITNVSI